MSYILVLTFPRVLSFALFLQSATSQCLINRHALLLHLITGDPKSSPIHMGLLWNYLKLPMLPNPKACTAPSLCAPKLCVGLSFLYWTAMRWEEQILYYALILPRRELKYSALKWLIQGHIPSHQKSQSKKLGSLPPIWSLRNWGSSGSHNTQRTFLKEIQFCYFQIHMMKY